MCLMSNVHTHVCNMSYMTVAGVSCGATGLWQRCFLGEKRDALGWPLAELSLCVSPPCMSCPDRISQLCSTCCPRCTTCLLHHHRSFSHLSLFLKGGRNAAGLMQRQIMWLWLSACGCERMMKEPAINMAAWWWGYLPICCFIRRLTTW